MYSFNSIANQLIIHRMKAGYDQAYFAQLLGLTVGEYSSKEGCLDFGLIDMKKICSFLNVSLNDIFK